MAPRLRGRRRNDADALQLEPSDELEQLFVEMEAHMALDRILEARNVLDKIEAKLKSSPSLQIDISDKRRSDVDRIRADSNNIQKMLHDLKSDEGWKLSNDKKGVKIHYRHVPGSSIHAVKTHTILEKFTTADFVHLCSMFVESDLMPLWFPHNVLHSLTVLAKPSKYRQVFQSILKLHFLPVSDRDVVCEGIGYHLTEEKAILVYTKSIDHSDYCDIPPPRRGIVRMEVQTIFFIQILDGDRVRFCEISHDNPKLRFVPSFVLNFMSQGAVPYEFIQSFEKVIREFEGSPWEKRIQENPDYYREIEDRLAAVSGDRIEPATRTNASRRNGVSTHANRLQTKDRHIENGNKSTRTLPAMAKTNGPHNGLPLWQTILVTCVSVASSRMILDRGQLPWIVHVVFLACLAALLTYWTVVYQESTLRKVDR